MMFPRQTGLVSACLLVVLTAACTQLGRVSLAGLASTPGSPSASDAPSGEDILPGRIGSGSSPEPGPNPSPVPSSSNAPLAVSSPAPSVAVSPTPGGSTGSPSPSPSVGPYGGLEAVGLEVQPSTLVIGVKTPAAITPVLPDTGVLMATVTLRGGSVSSRVTWKSASPGVMSIDENGVCKALDERSQRVQVTATTLDGRLERIVFVELKDRAQVEVVLDDTEEQ